jgi:DNA-binding MarR family transcriptional regulator
MARKANGRITPDPESFGEAEITLGILNAVDANERVTQRSVARELGIALGLANAYVKRCVKKGLIKVREVPSNRYAYYLTPRGFSEKSRLTAEYLKISFQFFRNARNQCSEMFALASERGWHRVALYGASELAEVAVLSRPEGITIVGIVDPSKASSTFVQLPVAADFGQLPAVDAVLLTALADPQSCYDALRKTFPRDRILTPGLLRINLSADVAAESAPPADSRSGTTGTVRS